MITRHAIGSIQVLMVACFIMACSQDSVPAGASDSRPRADTVPVQPSVSPGSTGAAAMPSPPPPTTPRPMQPSAEQILKGGCATSTVSSALLPSNLLFVLDRSGSMLCNPPPTTDS